MEIVYENPPNYEAILAHGLKPNDRVVFTYGNKLYNPGRNAIPDELVKHEELHTEQQGDDPDAWWERYLTDPAFRYDQEVKAYARQYQEYCKSFKDRNIRSGIAMGLAKALCGGIYGEGYDERETYQLIKKLSGV